MTLQDTSVKWFKKLPEEVGFFWFYGKLDPADDPEWGFVKQFKVSNGFMATIDGHFMFDHQWKGHFCRVQFPEKPPTFEEA